MTVYLVGAGPGDPGLVTVRGSELLAIADVVVYDRLVPRQLVDLAPERALRIDVGKQPGQAQGARQEEINELLVHHGRQGKLVVRLKGGDPFVFGRGGEEAEALAQANVPFEVVPGVSSAFAVPAVAGVPVTHRGFSRSVTVVTGHVAGAQDSRTDSSEHEPASDDIDWDALAKVRGTLVIMMGIHNRLEISRRLVAGGRQPATPVLVVQQGTTAHQRVVRTDLAGLPGAEVDAPAVIVVGEVASLDFAGVARPPVKGTEPGLERAHPLLEGTELALERADPALRGVSVVVTRAREQAKPLRESLAAAGANVVSLPVISVEDPPDGGEGLRRSIALAGRGRYDWVVFTSVNAVERTICSVGDERALAHTTLAAVGRATASALEAHGLTVSLVPERANAEALVDAMPDGGEETSRALFPKAMGAREVVPEGLRAKGWVVDEVVAYQTVPAGPEDGVTEEALEAASRADVVTFTSPSTVRFFLDLMGGRRLPPLVACIGPITAKSAQDAGLQVDVVSAEQSTDTFVGEIARSLAQRRGRYD